MNWLRFVMAWHIVVVGSGLWASAQDPVFRSDEEAEAASVMQAFTANMLALECFDMSMTYEKSHVATEDSSAMQSSFRWRYICDFRAGVHLIVGTQRVHQFSLESDEESRQRQFLGVFVNAKENESWLLTSEGTSGMDLQGTDAEAIDRTALHWAGYPDPRLVGSTPFPQPFIGDASIQELFHMSVFPKSKMILKESAENDRAEIVKTPGPQDSGQGLRARYLMDMERFVPLRLILEIVPKDGDVERKVTEKILWQEMDGMIVPVEIHAERRIKPKRKMKERFSEFYDVAFSWHSVNQPDRLPEVGKSVLVDPEAILGLLNEEAGTPDPSVR